MTERKRVQLWDPHKLYDLSHAEMDAIRRRAEQRVALKAEWQRKVTDPFKAEFPFDPAIQRFKALKATQYDHFRPTKKTGIIGGIFLGVIPAVLFSYVYYTRQEFERKCRAGEISAKDRTWKYVY
ncbi:uncharacterized protein LOC127725669 [Mytilus californianus]|uniref:uncharacterized protein LOC127725669 n=1 Tax=Mytilus californianus TaxID=6549 RepID=UPI002245B76D|nr:uncharacterized protein LOC127725669 [Mytilus californianus]